MSSLDIVNTKFDPTKFDKVPLEKLPYQVLSWINIVVNYLKNNPNFEESVQSFIVTELNGFLSYVETSKDIPSILCKPIRLELNYAYQLTYSGPHRRFLFETVNKLVKIVSASKAEKHSDLKQYVIKINTFFKKIIN